MIKKKRKRRIWSNKDKKRKGSNKDKKRKFTLSIVSTAISVIVTIISLIIAISSWNISKISLNVSEASLKVSEQSLEVSNRSYLLSSKDMEPIIDFEFPKNGVKVINNTTDLFKISEIEIMNINTLEFQDYETNKYIKVHIPILSIYELVSENTRKDKEIFLDFNDIYALGFNTFTHKELSEKVNDRLYSEYNLDSEKGFSSFGMKNGEWLIRIGYENEFKKYNSLYFRCRHLYGIGEFQKLKISEEYAKEIIDKSQVPKYKDIDDYWNIILNDDKYLESY